MGKKAAGFALARSEAQPTTRGTPHHRRRTVRPLLFRERKVAQLHGRRRRTSLTSRADTEARLHSSSELIAKAVYMRRQIFALTEFSKERKTELSLCDAVLTVTRP
jgi:hypothetical protein